MPTFTEHAGALIPRLQRFRHDFSGIARQL
jgi:hypothetical protein